MPKIVLFLDSPLISTGYASTCRLTAKEMARRGWEIFAVPFNGGPQLEQITDWYGIKILPNTALKRNPVASYGDAQFIIEVFNQIDPDILFFHNDSYRYSYIETLPKNIQDRSVFWLPFEGEQCDQLGLRLFNKCAATRFVTKHALDIHKTGLNGKDIGYIPHAVDLENFGVVSMDEKRSLKGAIKPGLEDKFVVSRVDRHQPRKYWDLTLHAFAKFAKGKEDVFFLGKCNPRDCVMYNEQTKEGIDLEKMAQELGIGNKVQFSDYFFNGPFMARSFYQPSDVFLTTTSGEGFGLTPVEAMACGTPVICPSTPVLPEVCADGALFCKLKGQEFYRPMNVMHNIVDVDDVVAKLEWAYADWRLGSGELRKVGEKGRKIVEEKYSPSVVYDQWNQVCRDVSEKRDLVSIITVLYNVSGDPQINGDDGIEKFRETMEKHVNHPYEWLIIDNGSPEREATRSWLIEAAKKNPRIKPIYSDVNLGFAGANNIGISMAKGEYVILANPDSEALNPQKLGLPADFVRMMVDKSKSDPYIGIVGMELNRRDDILPGCIFPYFCNVLITRTCLEACVLEQGKWLDEKYWPAYYEDLDFTIRAMGKGFKVVEHNVPFWHKSGGTNKYAIDGGVKGQCVKHLGEAIDKLSVSNPGMADFHRKRAELETGGMQGLIAGNIAYLNSKWGAEARQKVKIVWQTHIGAAVGFSQIAEGLVPSLHKLGFDVYINDWSNGSNIEDPLIKTLYEKTRRANSETDDLESSINIVCWLMETFLNVDADYKVGVSFCESTKVRPHYLSACNGMDRILTFSDFCRGVQKNSGYTSPIHVIPPGVHPIFQNYYERPKRDKFTFLAVGVAQDRKDTYRLVQAFCEQFPREAEYFPMTEPGIPYKPCQVELVLKSNNFGELNWVHEQGFSKLANIRTIFTGNDTRAERKDFTMQEMYDLYTQADCLVHPSHGEGIGMPILEAAATGLPVIFTNWSSPAEYLNETNSYPCCLGPNGTDFSDAYVGHGCQAGENGKWANINIGHLKHQMLRVLRVRQEGLDRGKEAAAAVKNKFTWDEAARYLIPLIFEWEADRKKKVAKSGFDPMTFEKPKMEPIKKGDRVLIDIVTRDRHGYLCSLLTSLLSQTFKDWDVIIQCDDADESMPHDHQIMTLMHRCLHEGHGWRIIRSHRQGPHIAHDRSLQMAKDDPRYKYKLMCRIDDDIYVKPDYLEKLFATFLEDQNCEIAAVSGVYPNPARSDSEQMAPQGFESDIHYAGKIEPNEPWPYICVYPAGTKPRPVEHLYSSFMFRVEAAVAIGGYCRKFSQIGHREESDFSYRFHLGGWKQYIQPEAIGYHYCAPSGGIRSQNITEKNTCAENDNRIYVRRLEKWRRRIEQRKRRDAEALQKLREDHEKNSSGSGEQRSAPGLAAVNKGKVVAILNCGTDVEVIKKAVTRFGYFAEEIYLTSPAPELKDELSKLKKVMLVACDPNETAMLMRGVLAEGDHEFVMTVADTMKFQGDPLALLSDDYDDYVFEVYNTYIPGRVRQLGAGEAYVADPSEGVMIGPECKNMCLLTRRRSNAKPDMGRTLYAEMMVLDDTVYRPVGGKSMIGNPLLPLEQIDKQHWRKVCIYQYPTGHLAEPRYKDIEPSEKLVSIIIPTAGRKQLLKQCIDSIYAHTTTPFEVIIIDNASSDGTADMLKNELKTRPSIHHFRQSENLGYQKAINIGMSKARGKYVLLFNDDAWVEAREPDGRDWLQVYIDELKANPKLGLVGPHGCDSPALGSRILFFWCVMFRRDLYDEIGPLDDLTFKNYGGDDDYCERVRNAGYTIKERVTRLRHLMTCIPDHVKKPELAESVMKLRAKYAGGRK